LFIAELNTAALFSAVFQRGQSPDPRAEIRAEILPAAEKRHPYCTAKFCSTRRLDNTDDRESLYWFSVVDEQALTAFIAKKNPF